MAAPNSQLREPHLCEIFMTWLVFRVFGRSVYRDFAGSLPLTGKETVLDFGCGMGTVAYFVAERLPEVKLTCVDISERWLVACKRTLKNYQNVSFLRGDIALLPLTDLSFDIIYSHFVLHDIEDSELKRVVPVLARLMKEKGKFIFREPMKDMEKIRFIQSLMEGSNLCRESSRITDIPAMGNALENVYKKV
ncbi:putative methyltransferase YcgJ [Oxobacter pfennigii]|uniref:Putative methyltransferase YcgJ n=1 Tax=Oxobacter pfennigii TaxID=36849 RepID=A0A0P8Y875_9CLOT|nr:class I SAM-dependent methyltransferase [Oxobacter pfennigii]KPU42868.1 putative methyltransferase YcgJ [Oxobacter pfennigii]